MMQWLVVCLIVLSAIAYVARRVYREWQLKLEGCANCALNAAPHSKHPTS